MLPPIKEQGWKELNGKFLEPSKSLREHTRLKRPQINELLLKRLPEVLDERQKNNHIDYLLKRLRREGKIHVGAKKYWELGPL